MDHGNLRSPCRAVRRRVLRRALDRIARIARAHGPAGQDRHGNRESFVGEFAWVNRFSVTSGKPARVQRHASGDVYGPPSPGRLRSSWRDSADAGSDSFGRWGWDMADRTRRLSSRSTHWRPDTEPAERSDPDVSHMQGRYDTRELDEQQPGNGVLHNRDDRENGWSNRPICQPSAANLHCSPRISLGELPLTLARSRRDGPRQPGRSGLASRTRQRCAATSWSPSAIIAASACPTDEKARTRNTSNRPKSQSG
jgi:hypothetical protein